MTVVIFLAAYLTLVGSLALHDPLLSDDLGRRRPAAIAQLHVLWGGHLGLPGRARLHVAVYAVFRGKVDDGDA